MSPCSATPSAARSTRSRPSSTSPVLGEPPVHAVFIRAPLVVDAGDARRDPREPRRRPRRRGAAGRAPRHLVPPRGHRRASIPRAVPRHRARRLTRLRAAVRFASMTINDWWRDRPEERYWMIAPSRGIVGDALSAPKALGRPPLRVVARARGVHRARRHALRLGHDAADAGHRRLGARARPARRAAARPPRRASSCTGGCR